MNERVAIVTGASTGIGREIAERLARDGWNVAFSFVGAADEAEATAHRIAAHGVAALPMRCDAGVKAEVDAFHQAVLRWRGAPDLLVNNAGIQTWAPLLELGEEDWNRVIRTNLTGCFLNTQASARMMRDAGRAGAIVNIGSGCNKLAFPNLVSYTASKGGIEQFTKVAALELGPLGIRVNCVAPGAIMTERTSDEGGDFAENWSRITPLRRIGQPADVASVIAFLAGQDSGFINGQTIWVDGGVFSQAIWAS